MKKYVFGLILLCLTSAVFAKQIKYKDFIIDKTETEIKIVKYLGNDSEIILFKSLSKIPVTAICSQAFMNNKTLESITIPTSCKEIGSEAFANCTSLKSVKLYGSEIDIAQNAFQNCNTFTISIIKIPVKKNDSDMTLSSSASLTTFSALMTDRSDRRTGVLVPSPSQGHYLPLLQQHRSYVSL